MRSAIVLGLLFLGCSSSPPSTSDSGTTSATSTSTSSSSSTSASTSTSTSSSSSSGAGGGGGGAIGCDPNDPTLSAQEQMLVKLPADSWLEIPNTKFGDFCPAHEPMGAHSNSGCASVINAWGGGAWDAIHNQMILWGGGHGDYWGNEVYSFVPKTMSWQVLVAGSPVASVNALSEPMADGTPVSRHTYDGVSFLTAENRLFAFGGATAPAGSTSVLTWSLDVENKKWKQLTAKLPDDPNGYYWMGSAYDEDGHRVFMRNESGVFVYDILADTWTRLVDGGYPPYWPNWAQDAYRRGVLDPKRKVFFTIGGSTGDGGPDFFAWDIKNAKLAYDDWKTTGGDDLIKSSPGADYDPVADSIIAWSGGAPSELNLTTKVWTKKSAQGAPPAPVGQGTYGRLRYVQRYNVFILVNKYDENVYFYKNTAGCG